MAADLTKEFARTVSNSPAGNPRSQCEENELDAIPPACLRHEVADVGPGEMPESPESTVRIAATSCSGGVFFNTEPGGPPGGQHVLVGFEGAQG